MGFYVNPSNESVVDFLYHYTKLLYPPNFENVGPDMLPVCLVDNGPYKAAGIAYSKRELLRFVNDGTNRRKEWFLVPIRDLLKASDLREKDIRR